MTKHRAAILLLALVAASALALGARADSGVPEGKVAVFGQLDGFSDGGDIRDGLIPVFVEPAGDRFLGRT